MAFSFESIKNTLVSGAGKAAQFGASAVKTAAEKGANMAQRAKLSADLAAEGRNLAAAQKELGKRYFEKYGEVYDEDLCVFVTAVKDSLERIEVKKAALEELKTASVEVEITAEPAPVEELPAEEVPAEEAPVEEAPAEEAPIEEAPTEEQKEAPEA